MMQIETPPAEKPDSKLEGERRGLVIVNTGDGKGKSTAAFEQLGIAMDGLGDGWQKVKAAILGCANFMAELTGETRRRAVDACSSYSEASLI